MKSRTSFFNSTAFKKNLTRFAPVWGLYTVCMVLGLILMMDSGVNYWLFSNLADCIRIMAVINLGYALICTQLLFGDLYNARMCNMLHALPIRREGWFITHIVSGLTFSFGPTLVLTLGALALCPFTSMVNAWQIPLLWLLGSNLEFVFFFGVASLAALCVGSRFAQAVVYGIVNFAAILAYWLVDTLYTPMYYGIRTNDVPFLWLTPVVKMAEQQYIDCNQVETYLGQTYEGFERYSYHGEFTVENTWWYLILCAAIGVGLMVLALQLYRKRRLETAGDFIAIKSLEPVFLVVYTMVVGTCFHFVFQNMMGFYNGIIFNFVGLAIGFFTGKMFLERRVNVFHKRSFLGCAALMAAFLLSLGISAWDPFGIEDWVPEEDEVVSAGISSGWGTYHQSEITLTDPADIAKVIAIHQAELAEYHAGYNEVRESDVFVAPTEDTYADVTVEIADATICRCTTATITLTYELTGGRTVRRYYQIWTDSEEGRAIRDYFSSVACVFGMENPDFTNWPTRGESYGFGGMDEEINEFIRHSDDMHGLLRAIAADCEAGTMCQYYGWYNYNYDLLWLEWGGHEFQIREINEHCMQWFRDQGFDIDGVLAEYQRKYG